MHLRTILTACFLLCGTVMTAQAQHACYSDSSCNAIVISKPFSATPDTLLLDTTLRSTYRPPVFTEEILFPAITGTSGRPAIDLFRRFNHPGSDHFYHNANAPYELNTGNMKVIRSHVPYSEWYYQLGANREQIFNATHAQDAGEGLNFGFDLTFINNKGAYLHEHAKASHLGVYGQYRNPEIGLESDVLLFLNNATTEENGGIADRSYFEDTVKINRQLTPVWLIYAMNTHKSTEVVIRNRWYPVKSPMGDAGDTIRQSAFSHHFSLDLRAKRSWWLYHDSDPFNPWYNFPRFDTLQTHDSVAVSSLAADLGYHIALLKSLHASAGVTLEGYRCYDTLAPGKGGMLLSPFTTWQWKPGSSWLLLAEARAYFDKDFGVSHDIDLLLQWRFMKKWVLLIRGRDWSSFPYRQDLQTSSNHFYWINEFKNQHYTQISPTIRHEGKFPIDITGTITRIDGLIYYNRQALPAQYITPFLFYQLLVRTGGTLGPFPVEGTFALQHSGDDANLLRQPALLGEVMTGVRFRMFSGKINAMAGVVVHGRSSAYVDQYMPVTRVFYHTSLPALNNYLWADPFITFAIKKTRFMLKYEHATAWLAGFGQYSIPGYPMTDPAIKFAVAWRFMN